MKKKSLQIQQLDDKMRVFAAPQKVVPPPTGWIKAVRTAITPDREHSLFSQWERQA